MNEDKRLGVTPPISTDPPKPEDVKASEALMVDLIEMKQFESEQERKVRERLLSNIAQLVSKFVHDVSIKAGLSEKVASEAGGRIYTSGSYRLGVHGPGSDIDTICVCPRHVYRENFFGEFRQMLRDWPAVTEISAVESAFVPVMKTKISGVEVDLLFARVNLAEAGDKLDIEKDEILRGVDDASQRSLNGPRVTDMILNLVPDVATYRTALRTIRLWAKRRGIYGNVFGFPGGVAWALMTARICQLYPTAAPATVVSKFFPIFYQWGWPQPVILKKIENGPPGMQHQVWNPRVDRSAMGHKMPIITPAYPSMCATHNISSSTMSVIKNEMLRAMQITDRIMAQPGSPWSELFEKVDFFSMYKMYVQVIASASSSDGIKDWGGTVESKLRTLVIDLENTDSILTAHPHSTGLSSVFYCMSEEEQAAASQGELGQDAMRRKEEDYEAREGMKKVFTRSFFIGLEIEKRPKEGSGSRILNLLYPSKRFCSGCQIWDKYDEQEMSVILRPAKRSELPFYCYPDGKPPVKKKGKRQPTNTGDSEMVNGDAAAGPGPSKRAKSEVNTPADEVASIPPFGSSGTTTLTPSLASAVPMLGARDADPTPSSSSGLNGTRSSGDGTAGTDGPKEGHTDPSMQPRPEDIAPPPAIAGMGPLSATAREGFASAANGVVGPDGSGGGGGGGEMGKVVLNGSGSGPGA